MTAAVLVLDVDGARGAALAGRLALDGCVASLARTFEHANVLARRSPVTVLVHLVTDPGQLEVITAIRRGECSLAPTAGIIALVEPALLVAALDCGADDAVATGAGYEELRARLAALRRRIKVAEGPIHRAGPVELGRETRRVTVAGVPLALRRLEFELLSALIAAPDRVVPRAELMRKLWGGLVHSRTLDAHASRLRTRLARAGAPGMIVAVRGVGYRLR